MFSVVRNRDMTEKMSMEIEYFFIRYLNLFTTLQISEWSR